MSPVVKSGKICSTGIALDYNDTARLIVLINPALSPLDIAPRGKDLIAPIHTRGKTAEYSGKVGG